MNKKIIQVKSSGKADAKKVTINLSNELNIYTIENVKKEMIDTINNYEEIEINTKDVKSMDLSFVQFFYSIVNSAKEKGKKIILNIELNEENKTLFENTDLTRIIKSN